MRNRNKTMTSVGTCLLSIVSILISVPMINGQIWRSAGRAESMIGRTANSLERTVSASRLSKPFARIVAPSASRTFSHLEASRTTMTNVASALTKVRSKYAGSITVAVGSVGVKSKVTTNPLIKGSSIATGTTTAAVVSRNRSMQEVVGLKRLLAGAATPQFKETVGAAIRNSELNAATSRTRALQAQFLDKSTFRLGANPIKLPFHGNSKKYFGPGHVYAIRYEGGKVYKYGESVKGIRDGKSIRAEQQVQRLNDLYPGKKFYSEVVENTMTKATNLRLERLKILAHREKYGITSLPGNRGNR